MKQPEAACAAYFSGTPTREELWPLVLAVSSVQSTVVQLAAILAEGGHRKEALEAVRPMMLSIERLNGLMREIPNAGVDPEWDHRL